MLDLRETRFPASFTATSIITVRLTMRPPARTFTQVASSQKRAMVRPWSEDSGERQAPSSGRVGNAFTRSSISGQRRLTRFLDMPPAPMALTRPSTDRVATPWTQACWIAAARAFSVVRRGSRKLGR